MASGDDVYPNVGKIGTILYGTDKDGNTVPLLVDGSGNLIKEYVFKESFDQDGLTEGVYTIVSTLPKDNMGFGIFNMSATDDLTFTINEDTIIVPSKMPFYSIFPKSTTITITGTSLSFNAFIEG